MPQILLTLGYQKRSLKEFLELLIQARVDVLIDVRQHAWSHKRGFSKGQLSRELEKVDIEYIHAGFAGNPKKIRTAAQTHADCLEAYRQYLQASKHVVDAFEELLDLKLESGGRVCITCYERHPLDCHRGVLAEVWARRSGRRVRHLATLGCERLNTD